MTAKEKIDNYLSNFRIKKNRFYGKCILLESGLLVLGDILSKEEGNLLLREDGDRLQIIIGYESVFFEPGKFYEFSIRLVDKNKNDAPIIGVDTRINLPILLLENPYQEIVRLRYERLDNPEANKMIANLMREIGKGLYSSKQRMIFELLQNADDTPAGDEINFHIDAYDDYLLFMHNGLPFNQDDVEAITSAAESTKRHDKKKTGYKGIGFKSVFTDSIEVIIKSGGFLFAFKRNHEAYRDFDAFYFSKKRYVDYPDLLEEDRNKFSRQRKSFNGQTDIPWQLLPIWYVSLPKALQNTRISEFNNNVGIAIRFGYVKVGEYLRAIADFAESPHFMLFLRHIKTFKSFKNGITIRKTGRNLVKIARKAQDGKNVELTYFKTEFDNIGVNDEDLHAEGVYIYKRQKENQYGEISHFFSYDEQGEKVIENIPPKLATFDFTTITFAAPVVENKIQAEESYLKGSSFSSFYTFLPMKEMRISLPFMVNADFVPDSSREKLQGDNEWNEYIVSKIAYFHLRWLNAIAAASIEQNIFQSEYLSLLLKDLLPADFSIQQLIDRYNKAYLKALKEVRFIISDKQTLCLVSEIILDSSGVSEILGSDIFYKMSKTQKNLPCNKINSRYLSYDYLHVERFTSNKLIRALTDAQNVDLFSREITALNDQNYVRLLKWLDEYYKSSEVKNDWLLNIPFIKTNEAVISINTAILEVTFHFRVRRTEPIESILEKAGYELSRFSLDDDDLKNIRKVVYQQNSYLKSEEQLYEHLITAPKLEALNSNEKNTLILFFKELENVGPARYVKTLALFKSKKVEGTLKPLGSLITNSCENLPEWLRDFVMDADEEKALDTVFKQHLLQEKDLLEKLFCVPGIFNEIIQGIDNVHIEAFYTYLLNLKKILPEDSKISYSEIPWVYIGSSKQFVRSSEVYWPDSLTKLEASKYKNVQKVLEAITGESMPHYAALQIKSAFKLGGKDFNWVSASIKEGTCDVLEMNDFLDWIADEGIKDFLNHYAIIKKEETYSILQARGTQNYYSEDAVLLSAIEASDIASPMLLLPKETYTAERKKIGLLEGEGLLKHLLDHGLAEKAFAGIVSKANIEAISLHYLERLTKLEIKTDQVYTKDSPEFMILKLALKHLMDKEEKLTSFKHKIILDEHPLAEKAISDDVWFHPTGKSAVELKTKLKDILPAYTEKTYSVSDVLRRFIEFHDDTGLTKIFKSESRKPKKILEELVASKPIFYTAAQTFFLSYFAHINADAKVLEDKVFFTTHYTPDSSDHASAMQVFLDICHKENYTGFVQHAIVKGFVPDKLVSEEAYVIVTEKLPNWLHGWYMTAYSEDKKEFLNKMGIQGENSAVVMYRKAILAGEAEAINKNLELITNDQLLINSLYWLEAQQQTKPDALKRDVLKRLYEKLANRKITAGNLLFPRLEKYDSTTYRLVPVIAGEALHLKHAGWGTYQQKIFEALGSSSKITDDVLPQAYLDAWKLVKKVIVVQADASKLSQNSSPFDADYYQSWSLKSTVQIRVYKGRYLPYQVAYEDKVIGNIEEKEVALINQVYYIVESRKEIAESSLEGVMPESTLNELIVQKHYFGEKRKKEEREITFTAEEAEAWKRLFGNEIPEDYYKDYNLAACVSALVVLGKKGYDVTKADANLFGSHDYAQVEPIYETGNEEPLTVMCRSAKAGILYLTAQAWNRLDQAQVQLFVKTGKPDDAYHLFKEKQKVLEVSDTSYQVFRVEASSNAETTDAILAGAFARDKVWLILRMRENTGYKSIFEGGIKWNEENPDIDDVNYSEDSPI